jgi:transcriptional regulator with XRE-family HTH domain
MSYIKQNFKYLRNKKGLKQEEFGALFGLSRDNIASYERGVEPKLDVLSNIGNVLHVSIDDLVNKDLAMEDTEHPEPAEQPEGHIPLMESIPDSEHAQPESEFVRRSDKRVDMQQVPLYNISASAGLVGLYNNTENIIDYIYIPNLPKCDGAVYVTGDSMYPLLKSGDIVAFQHTNDITNGIFFGEMYLISFFIGNQDFTTVKFINGKPKPVPCSQRHSN